MKKAHHRLRRYQAGNTILSAALGLAAMIVVGVGGTTVYTNYKEDQTAQARGQQLGAGLLGLEKYARKYQAQLNAGQAVTGVSSPYNPDPAQLVALGFISAGFDDTTQPGGKTVFQIVREPLGCVPEKCILALKVVTGASVTKKGNVSLNLAQQIAGYVPRGAGWSNLASDATKMSKNGQTVPNPLGSTPAIVMAASWLGNNQASQVVPPVSYEYKSGSCPAGQVGSKEYSRTVTTDKWGVVTRSGWTLDSDDCETPAPPPPPPSCDNGAPDYPTCTPPVVAPPPVVTPPVVTPPVVTPPVVTPPAGCTPTYTTSQTTQACGGGMVGVITITQQTNSCTGAVSQTGQSSSCSCPGGTTWDGASCKPIVPPPPVQPPTCNFQSSWYDNGPGAVCGMKTYEVCSDGTRNEVSDATGFHDWNGQCLLN